MPPRSSAKNILGISFSRTSPFFFFFFFGSSLKDPYRVIISSMQTRDTSTFITLKYPSSCMSRAISLVPHPTRRIFMSFSANWSSRPLIAL